jgi:hypothetical protein
MSADADLSVVIPSVNGLPIILECLGALRAEAAEGVAIEMLVVDRCGEDVRSAIHERFPEATVLSAERGTTIPAMRAMAFWRARGPAVAVIEDHVLVPRGWARQMLDAISTGHDVVGGGVTNAATERLVDRAAFLCEYSHLLPPLHAGEVETLTGNNVVYTRALLERYRTTVEEGGWEDRLHAAMRREGVTLLCRPEIVVAHKMHYRVRDYLTQRFLYARAYDGLRRGDNVVAALGTALTRLALPPILLFRIANRVRAARSQRCDFVLCLPLLVLFVSAWAAGEAVGALAGPGDALSRVR